MQEMVDVSLGFNTPVSTIIYLLGRDPQKLARIAAGRGGVAPSRTEPTWRLHPGGRQLRLIASWRMFAMAPL